MFNCSSVQLVGLEKETNDMFTQVDLTICVRMADGLGTVPMNYISI